MKQKHKSRLQAFLVVTFTAALLFVIGRMGALELDRITMGQALTSGAVGLAYMAVSAITYKYLGKEDFFYMNCGKWKVTSNYVGGEKLFSVYRLRDINEVDHSGNREYAGGWTNNREAAQIIADQLNCCTENPKKEAL